MTSKTQADAAEPGKEKKIIPLTKPAGQERTVPRPQTKRRPILWLSLVMCVVLPIAAVAVYFTFVATDRYAARAGFSIRGIETTSGIDGLGALTGLASTGTTIADSYIVLDYLKSRQLLENVDTRLSLRSAYSDASVDVFSRLDAKSPVEDFVDYWNSRIHTQFDPASGIIEFEVQAVSPEQARQIAEAVLEQTQNLVNDLSASARQDALRFAKAEVELQEARMREALDRIRAFRNSEQSVDPTVSAAFDIELVAGLEARLIDINTRISTQQETLDENAPSLVALRRQAASLKAQIDVRRQEISGNIPGQDETTAVTEQLARFETLDVDRRLAEQSYASAINSLEQATRDADRQQRYLAIHMRPQTPEKSEYPKRARNILVFSFVFCAAWGIATLLTYSVRDHLT